MTFTKITNNYNIIKKILSFAELCGKMFFDKQKCKHN